MPPDPLDSFGTIFLVCLLSMALGMALVELAVTVGGTCP